MTNKHKQFWYGLAIIVGLIIAVTVAYFLFKNFYHRPVLVEMVESADVVGYLEWEGDKESDAYNRLMSFDEGLLVPSISAWESRLHCALPSCSFWGKYNALVLRKSDEGVFPEFYFYQADKTGLLNTWQELAKGKETVDMFGHTYRLTVRDDLVIISFRPFSSSSQILGGQSISKMTWISSHPIPRWGKHIGFGFCDVECLNYALQQFGTPVYDKFPLVSAFLHDTVKYIDFLIIPEPNRLSVPYHSYFTSTYVSPAMNETSEQKLSVFDGDTYVLSGNRLKSKLDILASDGQNVGLWKTVMSLGLNEMMGKSFVEILGQLQDYPYEIHVRTPLNTSILEMTISDFVIFKDSFKETLENTIPILFPQRELLQLPDGTQGAELVKNKNISVEWQSSNDDQDFIITIKDAEKSLLSVYGKREGTNLKLSLVPLISQSASYCLAKNSHELQVVQLANPSLPLIWWDTKLLSSQETSGQFVFDRKPNSC